MLKVYSIIRFELETIVKEKSLISTHHDHFEFFFISEEHYALLIYFLVLTKSKHVVINYI